MIAGKEWPDNDTMMNLEDARFSMIRYFASDIDNADGNDREDPRTGEILNSNIGWHHNVMKLLDDRVFHPGRRQQIPRACTTINLE